MKSMFFLIFILLISNITAQGSKADWVPLDIDGQDKVFVDLAGIENFSGEDIYVWTLTEHSTPIVIESIGDKIFKTNTYYLLNTRLNKYSLLYVIYYDFSGNVLESFNYGRDTEVEIYQYNYPIWENSLEEKILNMCLEYINKKKN